MTRREAQLEAVKTATEASQAVRCSCYWGGLDHAEDCDKAVEWARAYDGALDELLEGPT